MAGEQPRYYAAARAGRTAIIDTATGRIVAWIARDGDVLRARFRDWISEPVETVPQAIRALAART